MVEHHLSESLQQAIRQYRDLSRTTPHHSALARPAKALAEWGPWAAAVSASVTMAGQAEAGVQFFAPPSPLRVEVLGDSPASDVTTIDLDGDGVDDFSFQVNVVENSNSGTVVTRKRALALGIGAGNNVVGSTNYAARLMSGSSISALQPLFNSGLFHEFRKTATSIGTFTIERGEWEADQTGLLGVKFRANRNTNPTDHFGWVRVETDFEGSLQAAFEVIEWAYEDEPLATIEAGDEIGSIIGDYNGDDVVDIKDYQTWRGSYGADRLPGAEADGNGDAVVNAADYTVWRDALNQAAGQAAASSAAPEPVGSGLAMLALGAVGVRALSARRRSSARD